MTDTTLTPFQLQVAELFFSLPESDGFLLAGGRAEARDFADVFVLAERFGVDVLLYRARQLDAGFDEQVLATMIGVLDRFDDGDIPVRAESVADLRRFFRSWREALLTP